MTTYTLSPNSESVNWNDPSVWNAVGGGFPNSPTADVVLPAIFRLPPFRYSVSIGNGQSYSANSLSIDSVGGPTSEDGLGLAGTLSVTQTVNVENGSFISLDGGSLSAGALVDSGGSGVFGDGSIDGAGQVNVAGTIDNGASIVGDGLTISAAGLSNGGTLQATSGNLTVTVSSGGFTNLAGSTLTGGSYIAGFAGNTTPNVLDLNVGGSIVTDAANIQLDGGGSIQTFDGNTSQYVPLQSTLTTIAQNGSLLLGGQTFNWANSLTDDGALALTYSGSNVLGFNAPQLTVGSNGTVSGVGTITAPVVNSGIITAGFSPGAFVVLTNQAPENNLLEINGRVTGTGTLEIAAPYGTRGPGPGVSTIYNFATLQLDGPASENVIFPSYFKPGGTLILDDPSGFTGSIDPGTGGAIIVSGVSYSAVTGYSYSGNSTDGTLTVQETGGGTVTLNFSGDLNTADFTLAAGPSPSSLSITVAPSSQSITVAPTPNPAPPAGTTADMIIRNTNDGSTDIFDLGSNTILGAYSLGQLGSAWQVAGVGGFIAGDTSDLMLRNSSTGAFQVYGVNNNNASVPPVLGQVALEWSVAGFGGFSTNAGETDMLLRDSGTGQFEVYDGIKNNSLTSPISMGQVGMEWQVAGFGDFSSNANETDMLMRNSNTGQLEIFDILSNEILSARSMGQIGSEWQILGFGDFSGNANETDMLTRDVNNGVLEIYDIRNNTITAAASIGQIGSEWQVLGFGPISGAGASDMLMRDANNGNLEVFDLAHNQITAAVSMGQIGSEWAAAGVAADPPGSANAQLTQAMASFEWVGAANSPALPAEQTAQSNTASLFAAPAG